jgi:prefoldin subunit 5
MDESAGAGPLADRVDELEAEVKYLGESLESLREESSFVRALIEAAPEDSQTVDPET